MKEAVILLLSLSLLGCEESEETEPAVDYSGFTKVSGKKLKYEMMVPEGGKDCGAVYECFETPDKHEHAYIVFISEVSGDKSPVNSAKGAKEWAETKWGSMKAAKQRDVGNGDFEVTLTDENVHGFTFAYFAKSKKGHIVAKCNGRLDDDALMKKTCASLKSLP